jgi:sugar-specific transcriptional regulator TrmB
VGRKKLEDTLKTFGFTVRETEIYIYLGKRGPQKVSEIAKTLKSNKGLVYRILKNLEQKGLVEGTLESPTRYVVVPFEKIIDNYVQSKREEAARIEEAKHDLLSDWKRFRRTEPEDSLERFKK